MVTRYELNYYNLKTVCLFIGVKSVEIVNIGNVFIGIV